MNHIFACSEVAYYMRRLYRQKLTTSLGGNISFKVDNYIYITPSQIDKDRLTDKDIIIMNLRGDVLRAKYKSSMETTMHLSIYQLREDIHAVIHAHSFWASLLALSDLKLVNDISDEAYYVIKRLAYCHYQTMGTVDLADEVAKNILHADLLVLKNHGVISTGKTIVEALERLEVLENMAHYSYLANPNICLLALSDQAKKSLDDLY